MRGLSNKQVLARHTGLAVALSVVISVAIHKIGEVLSPGTILGKMGNGKYRAYAEGLVTTAFGTGSAAFAFDPDEPHAKFFRVGDALESVAGVALGTILTYDPDTGAGTLTGNSAAILAIGARARITEASVSLGSGKGRILQEEVEMGENDEIASGFVEGFIAKTEMHTDAAIAKFGVAYESNEFKMKL